MVKTATWTRKWCSEKYCLTSYSISADSWCSYLSNSLNCKCWIIVESCQLFHLPWVRSWSRYSLSRLPRRPKTFAVSSNSREKSSPFWPSGFASRRVPTSPVWHSGPEGSEFKQTEADLRVLSKPKTEEDILHDHLTWMCTKPSSGTIFSRRTPIRLCATLMYFLIAALPGSYKRQWCVTEMQSLKSLLFENFIYLVLQQKRDRSICFFFRLLAVKIFWNAEIWNLKIENQRHWNAHKYPPAI